MAVVTFNVDAARARALKKVARKHLCSMSTIVRQAVDARLREEGVEVEKEKPNRGGRCS